MDKIYNKIEEPEILMKEVIIPENFPAIYIDENDNLYCYHSVIDKDRFVFGSQPYWLKGKRPSEIKDKIKGYFVIQNGAIFMSNRFIDEEDPFNSNRKCKLIEAYISFPDASDMSFHVCCASKYADIEAELTCKIFGLDYNELNELLEIYNKTFKCVPNTIFNRYPSITRSTTADNFCEISETWIPAKFPYIAFAESNYYFSHISIYGFYEYIKFITMGNINSYVSQTLVKNGLKKEILEKVLDSKNYNHLNKRITRDLYFDLNEFK